MCDFITLIAATADKDALDAVLARHERRAHPIDNPSVAKALAPGERQYLASHKQGCDCGTVLGHGEQPADRTATELSALNDQLRAKGWSAAKAARAVENRRKALARPGAEDVDSLAFWAKVVTDVARELKLGRVALLVHQYEGSLGDETFDVSRADAPRGQDLEVALKAMQADTVTVFRVS